MLEGDDGPTMPEGSGSASDGETTVLLRNCFNRTSAAAEGVAEDNGRSRLEAMTTSTTFQMVVAGVICLNILSLAVQADDPEKRIEMFGRRPKVWLFVNGAFILFFVAELVLRVLAVGCRRFACDKDAGWNLFDFSIVFLGCFDHVYVVVDRAYRQHMGLQWERNEQAVELARGLRLLRVLRVLSIFRHFSKLRLLAAGLLESVQMVSWIGVLTTVILFVCAIFCKATIGDNAQSFPEDEQAQIRMYFGTVARSMFTLFQFLTLDDWGSVFHMVVRQMPWMQLFFFPYIFFGAFVIMSLLTGVMADHINDVRRDEDRKEHERRIQDVDEVVKHADKNRDNELDVQEFQELFSKDSAPEVVEDLQALGIFVRENEARELFDWFDVDQNGKVDKQELLHGLKQLAHGLSPLQLYKLRWSLGRANEIVEKECAESDTNASVTPWRRRKAPPSEIAMRQLEELSARLTRLDEGTNLFENNVRTLMDKFGWKAEKPTLA